MLAVVTSVCDHYTPSKQMVTRGPINCSVLDQCFRKLNLDLERRRVCSLSLRRRVNIGSRGNLHRFVENTVLVIDIAHCLKLFAGVTSAQYS